MYIKKGKLGGKKAMWYRKVALKKKFKFKLKSVVYSVKVIKCECKIVTSKLSPRFCEIIIVKKSHLMLLIYKIKMDKNFKILIRTFYLLLFGKKRVIKCNTKIYPIRSLVRDAKKKKNYIAKQTNFSASYSKIKPFYKNDSSIYYRLSKKQIKIKRIIKICKLVQITMTFTKYSHQTNHTKYTSFKTNSQYLSRITNLSGDVEKNPGPEGIRDV